MTSEKAVQIFHTGDLGSASDWLKQISHAGMANQKYYPDLDSDVISIQFLHLFLRRHFTEKPVEAL